VESNGITGREMLRGVGSVGAGALLGSGLTTLARAPVVRAGHYRRADPDEYV
jgi:hypothetical protein